MEERFVMKDTFKKIDENYNDVGARTLVIYMLATTNNYVYSFLWEMVYVLSFFVNRTLEKKEITDIMSRTIEQMGMNPSKYNNLFNDYLKEGRVAIIRDCLSFIDNNTKKS